MGSTYKRLMVFEAALATLEEALAEPPSVIVRDATIQRFEYTAEAAWKALKVFLLEYEGVDCGSPKSCIRATFQAGLLNEADAEMFLKMIDDRNLTSHTYIEAIAERIAVMVPSYARLLRHLDENIKRTITA